MIFSEHSFHVRKGVTLPTEMQTGTYQIIIIYEKLQNENYLKAISCQQGCDPPHWDADWDISNHNHLWKTAAKWKLFKSHFMSARGVILPTEMLTGTYPIIIIYEKLRQNENYLKAISCQRGCDRPHWDANWDVSCNGIVSVVMCAETTEHCAESIWRNWLHIVIVNIIQKS